jgi:hypothetical protein
MHALPLSKKMILEQISNRLIPSLSKSQHSSNDLEIMEQDLDCICALLQEPDNQENQIVFCVSGLAGALAKIAADSVTPLRYDR